jgi:hypothetical protein
LTKTGDETKKVRMKTLQSRGPKKKEETKPDRSFTPNFGFDSSMPSLLLAHIVVE